jgi:hypothetical protein
VVTIEQPHPTADNRGDPRDSQATVAATSSARKQELLTQEVKAVLQYLNADYYQYQRPLPERYGRPRDLQSALVATEKSVQVF